MDILGNLMESAGTILVAAFFFVCVYLAYRALSTPEIKGILNRGGMLTFFTVTLIVASLIHGTFSFLLSHFFSIFSSIFRGTADVSDAFLFFRDLVAAGVLAYFSYRIYRSYHAVSGQQPGRYAPPPYIGLLLAFCLILLTACSSGYEESGSEFLGVLRNASYVLYYLLLAVAFGAAGYIAYRVAVTAPVNPFLRRQGVLAHILFYCVLANLLYSVLAWPISYLFNFGFGIANERNVLPILAYLFSAGIFVAGLFVAYRMIAGKRLTP